MSQPIKFQDLEKVTSNAFTKDYLNTNSLNIKLDYTTNHSNFLIAGKKIFGDDAKFTYNIFNNDKNKNTFKFESNNILSIDGSKFEETFNLSESNHVQSIEFPVKKMNVKFELTQKLSNLVENMSPKLEFSYGNDKMHSSLKLATKDNFLGMDNADLGLSYNAAGANIGAQIAYNFANSAINHHLKLAKSSNGLDFCLGLKQANLIELSASKSLNKPIKSPCGCVSLDLNNIHSKSTYDLAKSDWQSAVAFEYDNISAFGFSMSKGKSKLNLKSLELVEVASIKVNDSLSVNLGSKTNLDANFFQNWKIGAALNFSL